MEDIYVQYPVVTRLAAGIRFGERAVAEGWGTILKLSRDMAEMETHFPLKAGEKVYLTFEIENFYKFENVPAQVSDFYITDGTVTVEVAFSSAEEPVKERLRQAIVFLVDRK